MPLQITGLSTSSDNSDDLDDLDPGTYAVPAGTYAVDQSVTVDAGVVLLMDKGAVFNIASGKTLTIAGSVEAAPYQIFSGDGKVLFTTTTAIPEAYVEWWGATGANVNSTDAFAAALAAIAGSLADNPITGSRGIPLQLLAREYEANVVLPDVSWNRGITIRGCGMGATGLMAATANTPAISWNGATAATNLRINLHDLSVRPHFDGGAAPAIRLKGLRDVAGVQAVGSRRVYGVIRNVLIGGNTNTQNGKVISRACLEVEAPLGLRLDHIYTDGGSWSLILIGGSNCTVTGWHAIYNVRGGIRIKQGGGHTFVRCRIEDSDLRSELRVAEPAVREVGSTTSGSVVEVEALQGLVEQTFTLTAKNATAFTVSGSVAGALPDATLSPLVIDGKTWYRGEYQEGNLRFVIQAQPNATPFQAGNQFTIRITRPTSAFDLEDTAGNTFIGCGNEGKNGIDAAVRMFGSGSDLQGANLVEGNRFLNSTFASPQDRARNDLATVLIRGEAHRNEIRAALGYPLAYDALDHDSDSTTPSLPGKTTHAFVIFQSGTRASNGLATTPAHNRVDGTAVHHSPVSNWPVAVVDGEFAENAAIWLHDNRVTLHDGRGRRHRVIGKRVDFKLGAALAETSMGMTFTNAGSTNAVTGFHLPASPQPGWKPVTFMCVAGSTLRVRAQSGDSIRGGAASTGVNGTTGYVDVPVGGAVTLQCVTPGVWDFVSSHGTLTVV